MATHEYLWPNAILAIQGSKSTRHLSIEGGSVNYRLMDDGTAWILDPSLENEGVLIGHFENMARTGHFSLAGPKGVACEQGIPGAHRKFNVTMILGILKFATARDNQTLIDHCVKVMCGEVGLTLAYQYKGVSIIPAPRIKNEKKQEPLDSNRDRIAAMATGANPSSIRAGKDFWQDEEGNFDCILMRQLVEEGIWSDNMMRQARLALVPKLYLPIQSFSLPSGGFEALIRQTPEAEKAMGKDGCHFVHAGEDGFWWKFDWNDEIIKPKKPVRTVTGQRQRQSTKNKESKKE